MAEHFDLNFLFYSYQHAVGTSMILRKALENTSAMQE